MQVHAEVDCFWLILPPFSGWLQNISVKQIFFQWLVEAREIKVIPEPPSAVFSVCQNCYQKLVSCWHVFWQIHKFQIHKLVSRRDRLNISTMYSVFDWKKFKILSYRRAFLESTEISASEDLNALEKAPPQIIPLRILSRKGAVQIMPFRKLGGKFRFFLRFCTRKRSKTYVLLHSKAYIKIPCLVIPFKYRSQKYGLKVLFLQNNFWRKWSACESNTANMVTLQCSYLPAALKLFMELFKVFPFSSYIWRPVSFSYLTCGHFPFRLEFFGQGDIVALEIRVQINNTHGTPFHACWK